MNTVAPNFKNDIDHIPGFSRRLLLAAVGQEILQILHGRPEGNHLLYHNVHTDVMRRLEDTYNATPPSDGKEFNSIDHLRHCIKILTEESWEAQTAKIKKAAKIKSGIAGSLMAVVLPVAGPMLFDRYADYAEHGTNAPSYEMTRTNRSLAITKALVSDGLELSDYFDFITTRFDPALGQEIPLSEAHEDPYHIVRAHAEWLSAKTGTDQETLENLGLHTPDL